MNKIVLNNVTKQLNNENVLTNISIEFESRKIYGIFGRNGSGKTMLFRAICGLIKPTSGSIYYNNLQLHKEISFPPSIGVIIETPNFWNEFSGTENLKMLASIQKKASQKDISDSLIRVGLDPDDIRPVKKYSLGMRQRLAVAQGIMEKPDLIVFDEPTNALDDEGVELVRNILVTEKKRGAIVLIASHNKDDIRQLADVTYQMDSGTIKEAVLI